MKYLFLFMVLIAVMFALPFNVVAGIVSLFESPVLGMARIVPHVYGTGDVLINLATAEMQNSENLYNGINTRNQDKPNFDNASIACNSCTLGISDKPVFRMQGARIDYTVRSVAYISLDTKETYYSLRC